MQCKGNIDDIQPNKEEHHELAVGWKRRFPTWVSSRLESVGETLTNMSVLAVPPSESDMSMVSLWLR